MPGRIGIAIVGVLAALGISAAIGSAQGAAPTIDVSVAPRAVTFNTQGIAAGPTRFVFRNTNRRGPAEISMISLRPGVTVQRLRQALRSRNVTPAALKRIVIFEAGGFVGPRGSYTTTVDLKPNTTYVVANIGRNPATSPMTAFNVGSPGTAVRPTPDAVVGLYDFAFAMRPTLPRRGVVRFENRGERIHIAVAFRLRRGASRAAAVRALVRNQERKLGRLTVERDTIEPQGIVSGGAVNDVEVDFRKPGNWVFACFMEDGEGGAVHNTLGMVKAFSVR
jgi:hypothetical protein